MTLEETYDLWLNSPVSDLNAIESVLGGILATLKRQQEELDRLTKLHPQEEKQMVSVTIGGKTVMVSGKSLAAISGLLLLHYGDDMPPDIAAFQENLIPF